MIPFLTDKTGVGGPSSDASKMYERSEMAATLIAFDKEFRYLDPTFLSEPHDHPEGIVA